MNLRYELIKCLPVPTEIVDKIIPYCSSDHADAYKDGIKYIQSVYFFNSPLTLPLRVLRRNSLPPIARVGRIQYNGEVIRVNFGLVTREIIKRTSERKRKCRKCGYYEDDSVLFQMDSEVCDTCRERDVELQMEQQWGDVDLDY